MEEVKIHIEGEGLSFDGSTTFSKAAQIIAFVKGSVNESAPEGSATRPPVLMPVVNPGMSPRQVLVEANAKTNPQKLTALGKYLCDKYQRTTFSLSEAVEMIKRAGESMPRNLSRDLKAAVMLDYIYEDTENKGEYFLTDKARSAVEHRFEDAETANTKSRKIARKPNKNLSSGVEELEMAVEKDGLPSYWTIQNKSPRALWILAYAHKHGLTELTRKDVEVLAKRLHDNIPANDVGALLRSSFKKGRLAISSGKFRILQPGLKFIETYSNLDPEDPNQE